jgi:hypothetical protein
MLKDKNVDNNLQISMGREYATLLIGNPGTHQTEKH